MAEYYITPEMIEALRTLRKIAWGGDVEDAINVLDVAGVFREIDEASDYGTGCPKCGASGTWDHSRDCTG